ncbi:MAG: hypothetical protein CME31_22115 [Gimesia sp.]|uniref:Uncharacterized protein n=1 Tax=Gimesia maris TaxID=122 RepID=A0A3D3RET7_9PLAN|nr:hypothetical protein [Gimesia sp.]HCO27344.1 hypothetical protein [Gimesia maris]
MHTNVLVQSDSIEIWKFYQAKRGCSKLYISKETRSEMFHKLNVYVDLGQHLCPNLLLNRMRFSVLTILTVLQS